MFKLFPSFFLAFLRDIRYLVKITLMYLFGKYKLNKPLVWNIMSTGVPIVLVHGSSGNQMEWIEAEPFFQTLLKDHPIYAFTLDLVSLKGSPMVYKKPKSFFPNKEAKYNDWSIGEYVNRLDRCIKHVLRENSCDKVILIGHSMGGLVALAYETQLPERVDKIVTITTPIQGAPLLKNPLIKKILHYKRHVQMTPDSGFLSVLIDEANTNKVQTFGSPNDFHVPAEYAHFPTERNGRDIPGYGHFSIVSSPQLWEQVKNFLE